MAQLSEKYQAEREKLKKIKDSYNIIGVLIKKLPNHIENFITKS